MLKHLLFYLLCCCLVIQSYSQTTDLAVIVEAQNTNNADVSQVHIYQEFQYIVTIINSGNLVENATFSQIINPSSTVASYVSQTSNGGASDVANFALTTGNILTGTIASLPTNSSVEVKIIVIAPTVVGGIATDVTIFPPNSINDIDPSNNQSIISIDVVDADIDFTVVHNQITPSPGVPITEWGDTVTYRTTITNNSIIGFPLNDFTLIASSIPIQNGEPLAQIQSVECISATNGVVCPDSIDVPNITSLVNSGVEIYRLNSPIVFPINGSITFEINCKYLEGICAEEADVINVENYIELELDHVNISSNESNSVDTLLLAPEICLFTDIAIETSILTPTNAAITTWEDEVLLETIVSNFGSFDVPIRFFIQNLSSNAGSWDLINVTCIGVTGSFTCNDVSFSLNGQTWNTNDFSFPAGGTITVQTRLKYLEPTCTPTPQNYTSQIRSAINIIPLEVIDIDYSNNYDDDYITLLPADECPYSDLSVIKTQINPQIPLGSSDQNPMPWEDVTYEIIATNIGDEDTFMALADRYLAASIGSIGVLRSVECISASGGASCGSIAIQNIDLEINESSSDFVFWEITQEDAWYMPSGASVTFRTVHSWIPDCDNEPIEVVNNVNVEAYGGGVDGNPTNNGFSVSTYFTPCVDLIIQTLPSSPTIPINTVFDWIVDITNSNTSSIVLDADFSNDLNPVFSIVGTPTCQIENGTANCIQSFNINGNNISGIIPSMDAGSTLRITIPVMSPSIGGVFNNRAEVFPSEINNEEITPETNISISNVQVISPILTKTYDPEIIFTGQESTLTFTVHNVASNPAQSDISFIDILQPELTLTSNISWVNANGCTGTFSGTIGDDFVGISDLTIPEGIESCSFSVDVTSNTIGVYPNTNSNFASQNNIDTSQTESTLTVIEDPSNVDIEVLKTVYPEETSLGATVMFTITVTNLGTTTATQIEIYENLPIGYVFSSYSTTLGSYDEISFLWNLTSLAPNQSATLTITAQIISTHDLLNVALLNTVNEIDRDETNNEDSAEVMINNCLEIPNGISPNGDNFNDYLVIPCIENYPTNVIKIFNRLGVQIYQSDNYKNNWDGKPNMGFPETSKLLPVGTYYYILSIKNQPKPIIGWVYLNY
ncbi:hypothetical protein A9Q87_11110 [Flavobacteriales bacterium 34_180_T64]|nr:hypothetical protein A9Q87_11110 [Flavobacteriales bacterium 34_180_T64]